MQILCYLSRDGHLLGQCPVCGVGISFKPTDPCSRISKWYCDHFIAAGHQELTAPDVSGQAGQPGQVSESGDSLPGQGNLFPDGKGIHCPYRYAQCSKWSEDCERFPCDDIEAADALS